MSELRERIFEAVGPLKNARARERAAEIFEVALDTADKGQVLIALRAEKSYTWQFSGGELESIKALPKRGKTPPALTVSVDVDRLTSALPRARNVQQLAFMSGMMISGNSEVIVAVSREINRRCFGKELAIDA